MTLKHFQIFVKVCERLNMTAAAEALYLSQPAVSQAIKEMENYFGVKLFERSANRLRVTPDGLMLREYVDSLLICQDNIEKKLWIRDAVPEIRFGLDTPVWDLFMPQLLQRYMDEVGECRPVIFTNTSGNMMHAVATRELDFAIVNGKVLPSAALKIHKLAEDRLVFVCSNNSRFISVSDGEKIKADPDTIAGWPILLPCKTSAARATFNAEMSEYGLDYMVAGNFNNDDLLLRAVALDMGIGIISCREAIDKKIFRTFTVDGLNFESDINFIYQRNATLTPEMVSFREFVLNNFCMV